MPTVPQAEAEAPLALALDAGSSSVRAMLFDRRGRDVEGMVARVPYAPHTTSDGGVEVGADALLVLAERAVDEVLERAGPLATRIGCVGVSTFWHSLVGVDAEGRALTPVYTWADTRSARAAERLRRTLDEAGVHARTGAMLHPSYLPAKLVWLYNTRRELFDRAQGWMSWGEYFYLRLFGRTACSVSMASATGLFNQNARAWDDEVVGALPIRIDQLSPLGDVDEPFTGLVDAYARRWPALATVPWSPAVGDGACSNVGSGCVTPDRVTLMVGTSGAMRVVYRSDKIQIPRGLWTYRLDGKRFVVGGALSEGGNLVAWLDNLLRLELNADIESQLAEMEPDSHGLTVLPFVAGERSTGWATDARAAIVGMTLDTTPVEVLRAGLESVAYRFTFIAEQLPVFVPESAEVLGRPVRLSAEPEASSRGAALLALEALGAIDDLANVPATVGRTFEPEPSRTAIYRAAIERQRELYRLLVSGPWPVAGSHQS
jgi:gluconokinase